MPDFEQYRDRLGEFAVQAIIEKLERYEGIRHDRFATLEERWSVLMDNSTVQSLAA